MNSTLRLADVESRVQEFEREKVRMLFNHAKSITYSLLPTSRTHAPRNFLDQIDTCEELKRSACSSEMVKSGMVSFDHPNKLYQHILAPVFRNVAKRI